MSRVIFVLALATVTFSLSISASPKKDEKQGMTIMMDDQSEKEAEESLMMFVQTMKECNETFTIEKSYLQSLNESGTFPDETERSPKCYVRCLLEKTGIASEEGVYDPALMTTLLTMIRPDKDSSILDDITVKCNDRKETCKCERAYQYVKCVLQEAIKINGS